MTSPDSSLRLRPLVSLLLFMSAYAPLLLILVIKDYDSRQFLHWFPQHPWLSAVILLVAIGSCIAVLHAVRDIRSRLTVEVTKASNKSGEMFG